MQIAKIWDRAIRTPTAATIATTGVTATRPWNRLFVVTIGGTAGNGKRSGQATASTRCSSAALYGLQNLQRLDNDLSVSERHRALGFSHGSRQPDRSVLADRASFLCEGKSPQWVQLRRTQYAQMSSGLPLKADIAQCSRHFAFVPKPEVADTSHAKEKAARRRIFS